MRIYILSFILLFLTSSCDFLGGSSRTRTNLQTGEEGLAGTSCTSHSDCLGYCNPATDLCQDKEIGGVIISFTTKTSSADVACQTGVSYMAKGVKYPVCTCSISENIDCDTDTGTCLSNGMCSLLQGTNGGY